jgi:hypothetical protein
MDRRTFLGRSALGSGALLFGGCGAAIGRPVDAREARAMLARLERGLDAIRSVPHDVMTRAMAGHRDPELSASIFRLGLEALVVVDVARELPDHVPAPLAERLAPELPILDHYTGTYHALLASMPRSARRLVSSRVREQPEVAMDVAGWIDGHARDIGITTESRGRLRSEAAGLSTRMRRQSTDAVIDDCIGKVERVMTRGGASIADERARTTRAVIASVWEDADEQKDFSDKLASPVARPVGPERFREDREWWLATRPSPRLWSAEWAQPGDEEIRVGAAMLPFALVSCGLLLITGLIVMLAGAVQNAQWDGTPRSHG